MLSSAIPINPRGCRHALTRTAQSWTGDELIRAEVGTGALGPQVTIEVGVDAYVGACVNGGAVRLEPEVVVGGIHEAGVRGDG